MAAVLYIQFRVVRSPNLWAAALNEYFLAAILRTLSMSGDYRTYGRRLRKALSKSYIFRGLDV